MSNTPPWAHETIGATATKPAAAPPGSVPAAQRPSSSAPKRQRTGRGRLVTVLLSALVVVLVVAAGLLTWQAFTPDDIAAPLPASEFDRPVGTTVGATGQQPVTLQDGATGPGGISAMTVEKMAPNSLFIPAIGAYLPVEQDSTFVSSRYAGFETLRVPENARHGVRYASGAPMVGGDHGTTLIASHVSTKTGWGALRYLYRLKGGELIYTKDAAGKTQAWQMTRMRVENHTEFPQEYWSAEGTRQLVVVTCGGPMTATRHYTENVFAIATPVEVTA